VAPVLPEGPLGPLPAAAGEVALFPDRLGQGLHDLEDRLGTSGLGPLGPAWSRARQAALDALAELGGPNPAPSLAAEWGLAPGSGLQLSVSAPEASGLGRALLARLEGTAGDSTELPTVVVRARVAVRLAAPAQLLAATDRVAARLGLARHQPGKGPRPIWLGDAALPADVALVAREEGTGTWVVLRIRSEYAALDVIVPTVPGPARPALDGLTDEGPAVPPEDVPLGWRLDPAQLAGLEAALDAHLGLRTADHSVQQAAGDLLATCTARWAEVAAIMWRLDGALTFAEGRPTIRLQGRLTAEGQTRWTAATRPLPLAATPLPLGWQAGWSPTPFGGPEGLSWLGEQADCGAGHPITAALAALGILPRVFPPELLPAAHPPEGYGLQAADAGAGGLVGATEGVGGAVPHLVGLLRGQGAAPRARRGSTRVAGELRWVTPGPLPAMLTWRDLGGGASLVRFGLGEGATLTLAAPPAEVPSTTLFELVADAAGLARVLKAGGEQGAEVEALAALGERLGRLQVRVERRGELLALRAEIVP